MIHVRREIPEHPVIDAMERWGDYRGAGRGRKEVGRAIRDLQRYACHRQALKFKIRCAEHHAPTAKDGRYEGKKAVYILQVVL